MQNDEQREEIRLEQDASSVVYWNGKGAIQMGKYVIARSKSGFRFNLLALNGQIIGSSEVYTAKISCLTGIESVRRNAPTAPLADLSAGNAAALPCPRFELYTDRAGAYRFRLRARNGKIILVGEGYARKDGCLKGIESVRKNADSPVEE